MYMVHESCACLVSIQCNVYALSLNLVFVPRKSCCRSHLVEYGVFGVFSAEDPFCQLPYPLLVSSAAEAYRPFAEPHLFVLKTSQSILTLPSYLRPNYMPNIALFMQLSHSETDSREPLSPFLPPKCTSPYNESKHERGIECELCPNSICHPTRGMSTQKVLLGATGETGGPILNSFPESGVSVSCLLKFVNSQSYELRSGSCNPSPTFIRPHTLYSRTRQKRSEDPHR
jgi:hypothetical protein